MKTIKIIDFAGKFGENKDIAKNLRNNYILPSLKNNKEITLDFSEMTGVTQSFVHALISEAIRRHPDEFYEKVHFKNCCDLVKTIINIVSEYMQESLTE